ncbi:MAG: peroxiredoxin [Synechococcus sp.]
MVGFIAVLCLLISPNSFNPLKLTLENISASAADLQGGEQWGTTMLPVEGELAPDFELLDESGELRHLSEWQGHWVVLYFYPKDFTSGCTIEARRFQKDLPKYNAIDAEIIGISADSVTSHREFCDSERLKFPLLSDPGGEVSTRYGSWLGEMALRNTFIIDPDGVLQTVYPIVAPTLHSQEVLQELKNLQAANSAVL